MLTTITDQCLLNLVKKQINVIIPDETPSKLELGDIKDSLKKIEYCFQHIRLKYFQEDGEICFNHLHGDQYCMFLYFLSRVAYMREKENDAAKLFLLNKALFGIDVFYKIKLPNIFYFCHPSGTVLGNASYSNYFVVYQGVTVGSNLGPNATPGTYPIFGPGCALFANTTIIGDCNIGENVIFGANSSIINTDIDDNKIILGNTPKNRIINNNKHYLSYLFGITQ